MTRFKLQIISALLLPLFFLAPNFASAAISFDTSAVNAAVTSYTYTAGTLTKGLVSVCAYPNDNTNTITSATDGGNAMTLVDSQTASSPRVYHFVYPNAPSGAQTIAFSVSGGNVHAATASYNGVASSPIDSHTSTRNAAATSPTALTTTVVSPNDWLIGCGNENNFQPAAGSGTTLRQNDYYDSNGTVGTGSQSLNITWAGGTQQLSYTIMSLAPFVAAGTTPNFFNVILWGWGF